MKLFARITVGIVAMTAVLVAAVNGACWVHRSQAERAMNVIRTFRPGVTTEDEYLEAIALLAGRVGTSEMIRDGVPVKGAIDIVNLPYWLARRNWWRVEGKFWPTVTLFWAVPTFVRGRLVHLEIREMQGAYHADLSGVEEFGGSDDPEQSHRFDPSQHYWVHEQRMRGGPEPSEYFIEIDQTVTPTQRAEALSFTFRCFTSFRPCHRGADYMRQPIAATPIQ